MTTSLAPHPLLVPPDLAKEIGLHEAVILQQIHYWLEKSNHLINGCRWIYNTYQAWQEQFPFLSISAIRRAIARLEGMNLLKTERFNKQLWNQTKWYSINYQRLEVLISSICSNRTHRSAQIEQLDIASLSRSSTKTSAITTSKTTSLTSQEREAEKQTDKTLVVKSCTSLLAENKLVSKEPIDIERDLSSAATRDACGGQGSDHRIQNDLDRQPCKESPATKTDSSVPTQPDDRQHDRNGGNKLAASSNPPILALADRTQLLTRLSALTNDSVDNLSLNTALGSALNRYPDKVTDALEYFQQATATWKNRPGIGLFIHAVKSGQKPSLTQPGCGWKEWADEAIKRRLMEYSQSHDGDIMVHLVGGVSRLWNQLRSLSWSEIERVATGGQNP